MKMSRGFTGRQFDLGAKRLISTNESINSERERSDRFDLP